MVETERTSRPCHHSRTIEWGYYGITFCDPQPDRSQNFGVPVGHIDFPRDKNKYPVDGAFGSHQRAQYNQMCRDWVERGIAPADMRPGTF